MIATELKNSLSIEDIILFVTKELGSEDYLFDVEGNPIFQTICHNTAGQGKYKLYYYQETRMFHCYTECGDSFDIFELIIRAGKANDFIGALNVLSNFFGFEASRQPFRETELELTDDWDLINKYDNLATKKTSTKITQILPDSLMEYFSNVYPLEWLQEDISPIALDKYNIRVDVALSKIIIPHYNHLGELIGIRGRSFNPKEVQEGKKYSPIYIENTLYNHPLGGHLYGLNFNRDAIQKAKQVVIFEGEKSVLKAQTLYGNHNFTVACCGSSISDEQVNLLLQLEVNEIIIAFDKEHDNIYASESTNTYREKIIRLANKFSPYVNTYYVIDTENKLDYKDSPIDKGQDTLEYLLKHKVLVPSVSSVIDNKRKKKWKI